MCACAQCLQVLTFSFQSVAYLLDLTTDCRLNGWTLVGSSSFLGGTIGPLLKSGTA